MKSKTIYKSFEDIPAFNFMKFMETQEQKLLYPEVISEEEIVEVDVLESWEKIFQEYIIFMGIGEGYERIMRIENKIARLIIQRWVHGKKHLQTQINIERTRLNELKKGNDSSDVYEESAVISKYMGFKIDLKTTNAKEFFSFVKMMHKDG